MGPEPHEDDPLAASAAQAVARLGRQRRGQRRAAVLVIAALLVVVGVAVVGRHTRPGPAKLAGAPNNDPVAAAAFVDAVARSRSGTWKVDERFTRSFGGVEALRSTTVRVQTPTATLVDGAGVVTINLDGKVTSCTAENVASGTIAGDLSQTATRYHCSQGAGQTAAQRAASDADQLQGLRRLVSGRAPLYAVSQLRPGCFELRIRAAKAIAPPYGVRASLCFDPDTGAPTRTEVEKESGPGRPNAVDLTAAADITGTVTDADLQPPKGALFT